MKALEAGRPALSHQGQTTPHSNPSSGTFTPDTAWKSDFPQASGSLNSQVVWAHGNCYTTMIEVTSGLKKIISSLAPTI